MNTSAKTLHHQLREANYRCRRLTGLESYPHWRRLRACTLRAMAAHRCLTDHEKLLIEQEKRFEKDGAA